MSQIPEYKENLLIANYVGVSPSGKFVSDWYDTPVYWQYEASNFAVTPSLFVFHDRDACDHVAVYEKDTDSVPQARIPYTPKRESIPKRLRLDYQEWKKERGPYAG